MVSREGNAVFSWDSTWYYSHFVWLCVLLRGVSCWVAFLLVLVCFVSPVSIVIASVREERAGLCASRAFLFIYFAHGNFHPFRLLMVSGIGCGLWLWHSLDFSFITFMQVRPKQLVWLKRFASKWHTCIRVSRHISHWAYLISCMN